MFKFFQQKNLISFWKPRGIFAQVLTIHFLFFCSLICGLCFIVDQHLQTTTLLESAQKFSSDSTDTGSQKQAVLNPITIQPVLKEVVQRQQQTQQQLLFLLICIVVLGSLLTIVSTRILTSPIQKMVQFFDYIKDQHLSKRLDVAGQDVLSQLASKISQTVNILNQQSEELQHLQHKLIHAQQLVQRSETKHLDESTLTENRLTTEIEYLKQEITKHVQENQELVHGLAHYKRLAENLENKRVQENDRDIQRLKSEQDHYTSLVSHSFEQILRLLNGETEILPMPTLERQTLVSLQKRALPLNDYLRQAHQALQKRETERDQLLRENQGLFQKIEETLYFLETVSTNNNLANENIKNIDNQLLIKTVHQFKNLYTQKQFLESELQDLNSSVNQFQLELKLIIEQLQTQTDQIEQQEFIGKNQLSATEPFTELTEQLNQLLTKHQELHQHLHQQQTIQTEQEIILEQEKAELIQAIQAAEDNFSFTAPLIRHDFFKELTIKITALFERLDQFQDQLLEKTAEFSTMSQHTTECFQKLTSELTTQQNPLKEVSQYIESFLTDFKKSMQSLNSTSTFVEQMHQLSTQSDLLIKSSHKSLKQIGVEFKDFYHTIELMKAIAKQSHYLALNASIEAARAGKNTQGFTVVANEIKNLSQAADQTTDQISSKIETLSQSVSTCFETHQELRNIFLELLEKNLESKITVTDVTHRFHEQEQILNQLEHSIQEISQTNLQTIVNAEESLTDHQHLNTKIINLSEHLSARDLFQQLKKSA